jgi:hypothetical protein
MKLARVITRLVRAVAGVAATKQLLDTATTGPSIEPTTSIGPRILQGPYRSAEVHHPPTCTECEEVVDLWCGLCRMPIELGEQVFCPKEPWSAWAPLRVGGEPAAAVNSLVAARRRRHDNCRACERASAIVPSMPNDAVASAMYEIAAPRTHVHRACALVYTTHLFTRAITDITRDG